MKSSYLLLSILKGQWAILPRFAELYSNQVTSLINRNWDQHATHDLDKDSERAPVPVFIYSESGNALEIKSGYDQEEEDDNCNPFDKAPIGSTAIIPIKGVMIKYGTLCQYGTEELAALMQLAVDSPNISSIILDIDTGGGSVDSVAPIVEVIKASKKPCYGIADLCASAGYWIGSQCEKLYASNDISSEFGSIGVMMSFADVKPYYKKMGVKFHTIYAKESSYKNRTFEEALNDNYQPMQDEQLSPLAQRFQETVKNNRGSRLNTSVEGILEGRMFFAKDALSYGLIDGIITLTELVRMAQSEAQIRELKSNYQF